MSNVYSQNLRSRNQELRDLLHDYPELEQSMILQARRDLLEAERTAISDANQRGLISEDIYHELIRETDDRRAALNLIEMTMQERTDEE
jgi:hypothetical protein